jgi:hypothetical protein
MMIPTMFGRERIGTQSGPPSRANAVRDLTDNLIGQAGGYLPA